MEEETVTPVETIEDAPVVESSEDPVEEAACKVGGARDIEDLDSEVVGASGVVEEPSVDVLLC